MTTVPLIATSPASGVTKPATERSVVVLPHPDGPSRVKNSPGATARDTPSSASVGTVALDQLGQRDGAAGAGRFRQRISLFHFSVHWGRCLAT